MDELHSSFPPPFCKAEGIAFLQWDTSAWPGFRSYGRELLVPVLRVLPLTALHQPAFTDSYARSRYSLQASRIACATTIRLLSRCASQAWTRAPRACQQSALGQQMGIHW